MHCKGPPAFHLDMIRALCAFTIEKCVQVELVPRLFLHPFLFASGGNAAQLVQPIDIAIASPAKWKGAFRHRAAWPAMAEFSLTDEVFLFFGITSRDVELFFGGLMIPFWQYLSPGLYSLCHDPILYTKYFRIIVSQACFHVSVRPASAIGGVRICGV